MHGICDICHRLEFQESVLCDLNRCIQEEQDFECHAFKPILKLVGPTDSKTQDSHTTSSIDHKEEYFQRHLDADKIKYEKALALQKLGRDPDGVYIQLKYHLAWNVRHRRSVFQHSNDFMDLMPDIFLGCSELVGGFAELLFLAPDHVHVYVESDGELSVEEMAHRMKESTNNIIMEKFPFMRDKIGDNKGIWDESYFVETVG